MSLVFTMFAIALVILVFIVGYFNNKLTKELNEASKKLKSSIASIHQLQNEILEESKQKVLYRDRSLELEDAIKEGVGVSLRNEVTRVECVFDQKELTAMLEGVKHLIKEYWQSTAGVKFYLAIIEKIEKNVILMNKAEDEKNQNKV